MTLKDIARALRERWRIVVAAALIGLLAAGVFDMLRPQTFTSKLTLYVAAQNGGSATAIYQGNLLSEKRVKSYTELASSPRVGREVGRRLGLTESPKEVAEAITATSLPDSVLIDVEVSAPDPAQAVRFAATTADVVTAVVADLERPAVPVAGPEAAPPVAVRVVQAPTQPTAPAGVPTWLVLCLGALGGLLLGGGLAVLRSALDTSVKSVDQLKEATDSPNVGAISHDPTARERPLVVDEDPRSSRSEAFRQLRTNLQFVDLDHPRKVLVVTSSLPGEGKSTTVANLALALAARLQRVVVVDADLRRPRLHELFGLDHSVGVTSVLSGGVGVTEAVQQGRGQVDVLAAGPLPPNPSELLASAQMQAMLATLREQYDVVLLDTPPLLPVTDAAAVSTAVDGVILVCRYRKTTRAQLTAAVRSLTTVRAPLLGTIFTMCPAPRSEVYGVYGAYAAAADVPAPRTQDDDVPAEPAPFDPHPLTEPIYAIDLTERDTSPRPAMNQRGRA